MITVKFKRLHPDAKMPFKAHQSDFCYDCYAVSCEQVAPNVYRYGLGFALQLSVPSSKDASVAFTFRPRSSVWKTGMMLSSSIGTVDKGYTGEISAVFYHVFPDLPKYEVGDRVCQMHIESTANISFQEVDELTTTDRGNKGYGSTGK